MEESVALDSSNQKKFVKSVKGIKKLLKKQQKNEGANIAGKTRLERVKNGKVKKRKSTRGLVYLGHIPHGFYEHQMTEYFKQFGYVSSVRVIRSKRTGNSKGYGFVEFKDPAVAQIVAETMNNYLMGKRLIKAQYIPPEKQRLYAKAKKWSTTNNPGLNNRIKNIKKHNSLKTDDKNLQLAKGMLATLNKTKKKLKDLGIDYDFFTPVDIPKPLLPKLGNNYDESKDSKDLKPEIKKETSKNKAANENTTEEKVTKKKSSKADIKNEDKKLKKEKANVKKEEIKTNVAEKKKKEKSTKEKKEQTNNVIQKQKRQSLKESNVKPLEEFFSVEESDGDSDGSLEFDSDEFEKAMAEDDSMASSEESDESLNDEITSDEEEEVVQKEIEVKPKTIKAVKKGPLKNVQKKPNQNVVESKILKLKEVKQAPQKVGQKKPNQSAAEVKPKTLKAVKKATQEVAQKKSNQIVPPKQKLKFEKSTKKPLNKMIKKKK